MLGFLGWLNVYSFWAKVSVIYLKWVLGFLILSIQKQMSLLLEFFMCVCLLDRRSVSSLACRQKDLKLSRVLQMSLFRFLVLGC